MALITFGSAPTKGATSTATLNKTELLAIPEVVADSFWSDGSNIKSVEIMFESVGGGQAKPLVFNFSQTTPTASLVLSEKARSSFQVKAITLRDFDDGIFTITRAVLLASSPSVAASVSAISFVPAPVGGGDTTPPVPGFNIGFGIPTQTSVTVAWGAASDNVTALLGLQYKLVSSTTAGALSTVAQAESNGTVRMDWTAGTFLYNVTGLSPSTTYYFAVLVRDSAGNKAVYTTQSVLTDSPPNVAPSINNYTVTYDSSGFYDNGNWIPGNHTVEFDPADDLNIPMDVEIFVGVVSPPYTTVEQVRDPVTGASPVDYANGFLPPPQAQSGVPYSYSFPGFLPGYSVTVYTILTDIYGAETLASYTLLELEPEY